MLPFKQLSQMVLVQGVSAIGPFLVLPVVARASDDGEWSAFVLGQTVGLLVAVLASFGWPLSGINQITQASTEDRRELFFLSISTRLVAFLFYMPIGCLIVSFSVDRQSVAIGISTALAIGFYSTLIFSWYFVAIGTPYKSLIYGVSPMLLAAAITTVLVLVGLSSVVYGPVLLSLALINLVLVSTKEGEVTRKRVRDAFRWRSMSEYYRSNFSVSMTQVVASIYVALPMVFATAVLDKGDADSYATANRLMVLASTALLSTGSVLQAWSGTGRHRRAIIATCFTVGLGILGLVFFSIVGVSFSRLVFGADVSLSSELATAVGCYVFLASVRVSSLRYYLIPRKQYTSALLASIGGLSVLALVLLFFLACQSGRAVELLMGVLIATKYQLKIRVE